MSLTISGARLFGLGLLLGLWPILVVHGGYAISIIEGYVPFCNPYWDGCTSISRAGRHGLANHLFKGALLPYTVLLAIYWWINQGLLLALGDRGSRGMLWAGWLGVLFMILYLTFLGSDGAIYQLMRRYGINGYFGGTFIAQLLLIDRLRALQGSGPVPWPRWVSLGMLLMAVGILSMGVLFVAVDYGLPLDRDRLQNTLEWTASLLMQAQILLSALIWRAADLQIRAFRGPPRIQ